MNKTIKEIMVFIGSLYTANFIFSLIISLIGAIPFVKEYNDRRDKEISAQIKQEEVLYKKSLIGKYAMQPQFDQYDGLLRAYRRIQFPVVGINLGAGNDEIKSMLPTYNSLEECSLILTRLKNKNQECKRFTN